MRLNYKPKTFVPFSSDYATELEMKQTGMSSEYSQAFTEAVDRVEKYFNQRLLYQRTDLTPEDFFEELKKDDEADDEAAADPNPDLAAPPTPSPSIKDEDEVQEDQDEDEEEEEEEAVEDQPEEQDSQALTAAQIRVKLREEMVKEKNQKYVDFIRTDPKLKEHLLSIAKGTKSNDFHEKFQNTAISQQRKLVVYTAGPIDDDEQIEAILDAMVKIHKILQPASLLPDMTYIQSVLFPEAVVYALMKIRRVSRAQAVDILFRGAIRTKDQRKLQHDEIIASSSSIDPEYRKHRRKVLGLDSGSEPETDDDE